MDQFNSEDINSYEELNKLLIDSDIHYKKDLIKKAYDFAEGIHINQKRKSGQNVLKHVLTVAAYIVRLRLDTTAVVSALLHESLDTDKTNLDQIDREFGTDVAFIIDGITNMKKQTAVFSSHNEDPENFRKLILASAEDIRILIIRLTNKFHNLKTIEVLPVKSQINQANKIKLVYSPICEYLGLGAFHHAFENKSFEILNKKDYDFIKSYSNKIIEEKKEHVEEIVSRIQRMLTSIPNEQIEISFRTKNFKSTYKKVIKKYKKSHEELSEKHLDKVKDIIGVRIITQTVESCYLLLGLIHKEFEFLSEEFADYVANPKPNGYKSVHTVIKHEDVTAEIQLRTVEMHEFNEFGPASHIAYKLQKAGTQNEFTWTKDLVSWKESRTLSRENFQFRTFQQSVFTFTPMGEVIMLPKGSTPLDFAYKVHTSIGHRYLGALVNGKMVKMTHKLETGDVVEIKTGKNPNVRKEWESIVKSGEAYRRIRRYLKLGK